MTISWSSCRLTPSPAAFLARLIPCHHSFMTIWNCVLSRSFLLTWVGHTAKRDGRCLFTAGMDAGLFKNSSGGGMGPAMRPRQE
jgi:hypothetical protein